MYPDTSVIVSAYTEEPSSTLSEAWIASLDPGSLTSSWWCETEVAGALSAKSRANLVTIDQRRQLSQCIRALLHESAAMIAVDQHHFTLAADLLLRSAKPLRSGDALHLAIAARADAKLFTLDRRMAEAGVALGLDVVLLG